MAVQKFPPPPNLGTDPKFQQLNRWLIEIQSILNSQGEIDPGNIVGLPTTYDQVGNNSTDIQTLFGAVQQQNIVINAQSAAITTLQAQVAALQTQVNAIPIARNGVTAPAAGLGNVGDWYADTVALHIYVKTAAATWTQIV